MKEKKKDTLNIRAKKQFVALNIRGRLSHSFVYNQVPKSEWGEKMSKLFKSRISGKIKELEDMS